MDDFDATPHKIYVCVVCVGSRLLKKMYIFLCYVKCEALWINFILLLVVASDFFVKEIILSTQVNAHGNDFEFVA